MRFEPAITTPTAALRSFRSLQEKPAAVSDGFGIETDFLSFRRRGFPPLTVLASRLRIVALAMVRAAKMAATAGVGNLSLCFLEKQRRIGLFHDYLSTSPENEKSQAKPHRPSSSSL
ncbi:hypothetical protein [Rhizobium sp.]